MTIRTWSVIALLLCASCKKKDDAVAVAATGGAGSAARGAYDPWNSPPAKADTAHGARTGDELAKLSASTTVPAGALQARDKTEQAATIKAIAQPTPDTLAIKGFANVDTSNGFRVTYNPSQDPSHEGYRQIFVQNRVFENVAEGLNKTVRVPSTVEIQTVDCGTVNAFYDPNTKRIIVCYELLDYFLGMFKPTAKNDDELGNAVMGAVMFAFFHEAGHGLIHILDLPAVGREEDSVDQLATLILIAGGDPGVAMALSGAYWFQLQSKQSGNKTPFWNEHAFDGQRFYNILCLIYGSAPEKYGEFVTSGNLPKDRAQRCPEEYRKINKAWEKLLQPHMTNAAATNVDYKPSVPAAEAPQSSGSDPWGDTPTGPDTTTETPQPPEPEPTKPALGIPCEQIAEKVAELIGEEAQSRAKSMSMEDLEALRASLEAELPAALEQILSACAKDDWSSAARACILKSRSLAAADKCGT
ncbi:MAG: DUF4344 domain-containing metallopeptidase [Deltaproteobacteria bacterium]|nr:DUF4344 domain-containing metallopeptidase [Deltaproteobacteria bacterium]